VIAVIPILKYGNSDWDRLSNFVHLDVDIQDLRTKMEESHMVTPRKGAVPFDQF